MEIVIVVIAGTGLLIGIVAYFINRKNKNDEWEGELVDKQESTKSDSNDGEYTVYTFLIKTSTGNKQVAVKKKIFQQFAVGDHLIKAKGQTAPVKK